MKFFMVKSFEATRRDSGHDFIASAGHETFDRKRDNPSVSCGRGNGSGKGKRRGLEERGKGS